MYQLEETFYFYLLILIPLLLVVFFYNRIWQKNIVNKHFNNKTFKFLSPEFSSSKSLLKTVIKLVVILF